MAFAAFCMDTRCRGKSLGRFGTRLAEDQEGIPRLDLEQIRIGSDGSLSLELSYLEQGQLQPLQGEILDIGKLTFTQLPKLFGIF